MRPLAYLGAGSLLFAMSAAGCQFFFPTPIAEHEAPKSAPPAMVRAVGAPFRAGEVMKGEVFLDSIRAGTGELRVTEACDDHGKPAVLVVVSAASSGLLRMIKSADTKSEVFLDVDSGAPISAHAVSTIGDETTDVDTVYAPAKYLFKQRRTTSSDKGEVVNIFAALRQLPTEGVPHNADSLLGYLRNWKPAPLTTGYVFAVFGKHPWRADMTFVGPETITTAHGQEKVLRIDGVGQKLTYTNGNELGPSDITPRRPFSIWISDDDRRAPLRIVLDAEIAKVTVELDSYALLSDSHPDGREIEKSKRDPASAACKPLFDSEALERDATIAEQTRGAHPDDENSDEKDGIQKILKTPE